MFSWKWMMFPGRFVSHLYFKHTQWTVVGLFIVLLFQTSPSLLITRRMEELFVWHFLYFTWTININKESNMSEKISVPQNFFVCINVLINGRKKICQKDKYEYINKPFFFFIGLLIFCYRWKVYILLWPLHHHIGRICVFHQTVWEIFRFIMW